MLGRGEYERRSQSVNEEGANQTLQGHDLPRVVIGCFAPTHVSEQTMLP